MSSARSSFLRRGCCFPESHPALLFPPVFPFSLLSMKPAGHPPRSVPPAPPQKPAVYLPGLERRCSQRWDTCRWTRPLGGAAGGAGTRRSPARSPDPRRAQCRRPGPRVPAPGNVTCVFPPWSEGHGGQRSERPSPHDWSPSRQALVAKPRAAASSCGEVGRSGRVWIPVRGLRQVGSPPYLHFQRECRDQEAARGPEGRLALAT